MNHGRLLRFSSAPAILAGAASVGKTEGEGPLGSGFDIRNPDDGVGEKSWEAAEAALVRQAVARALEKAEIKKEALSLVFAGDLLNQCTASTFGLRDLGAPVAGLFGACSTFALALCLAAMSVDGGYAEFVLAEASSHFCAAEKQFRFPLEYGGQRPQTAQRTVTGAGACVLGRGEGVRVTRGMIGAIADLGVKDAANMGAAMAPAAARTIACFLEAAGASPGDYDRILTGDLGGVGSELLKELLLADHGLDIGGVHADCGNMIFDPDAQDVHAGGSGCGCSAAVVSTELLRAMRAGELHKVLFVGTGALMSPLTALQGENVPAVAHAVELTFAGKGGEVGCKTDGTGR